MQVRFDKRDFTKELILPDFDFQIQRYSKAAIGGPLTAEIKVLGADRDLWSLIGKLRSPVTIFSNNAKARWWGYLDEVKGTMRALGDPNAPRVQVGVSLREMYNRIAVPYASLDATSGTKTRETTDWADDDLSQGIYGIKELLASSSAASAAQAESARDMKLAMVKYPIPIIDPVEATESSATLYCRGWWDTLAWLYYQNLGHADWDTAEQVYVILNDKGQFFSGIDLDVWADAGGAEGSGLDVDVYRNGDDSAYFLANELLAAGTSNQRRMLAIVNEYRRVRIFEEPTIPIYPYLLTADGGINDPTNVPIDKEACPVGIWARTKDVIPGSVDMTALANPSLRFIDQMEYDATRNWLDPTARGDPDPFKTSVMRDG